MNTQPTLLAYIAPRLATGEENLATESLCFVLSRSAAARTAFIGLLSLILEQELPALTFGTQAADADGTIPDLVGLDTLGKPVVYVEVKFWAGLTESQPVGYLERLQREGGLGLVVLAPANRLATLWPELARRCSEAGLESTTSSEVGHQLLAAPAYPPLALTSWSEVLAQLMRATEDAGDAPATEDLRQLRGLCDRMEEAGFHPLRGEELTGNLAQRIEDYCGLVDDVTAVLVGEGLASTEGLKASGGRVYYTRYVKLKGNAGQIAFHADWWAKIGTTPLWVWLKGPDWKPSDEIRLALQARLAADPPEAYVAPDGAILVPLALPVGCERPDVLASLASQVRAVCDLIPEADGEAAPPDAEA